MQYPCFNIVINNFISCIITSSYILDIVQHGHKEPKGHILLYCILQGVLVGFKRIPQA